MLHDPCTYRGGAKKGLQPLTSFESSLFYYKINTYMFLKIIHIIYITELILYEAE